MADLIDSANKAATNNQFKGASAPKLPSPPLDKLPKIKDPELIKKKTEALAQQKKADAKLKALTAKDDALEAVKQRLFGLLPLSANTALLVTKKMKDVAKERAEASKENLKKSVEAFTYPIKPTEGKEIVTPPKVPPLFK